MEMCHLKLPSASVATSWSHWSTHRCAISIWHVWCWIIRSHAIVKQTNKKHKIIQKSLSALKPKQIFR